MKRVNVQFEETTYKKIKTVSFIENKSFAAVVREGMAQYLANKNNLKQEFSEALDIDDQLFLNAMEDSFDEFDDVYKKLAE